MRYVLLILLIIGHTSVAQVTKTTTKEIGKVGKLTFSNVVTGSDTFNVITQSQSAIVGNPYDIRVVNIKPTDLAGLIDALSSFKTEVEKKGEEGTSFNFDSKNGLLAHCLYTKIGGWSIMIQNDMKKIETGTAYQLNTFVEIKPKQLEDVIKLLRKIQDGKN